MDKQQLFDFVHCNCPAGVKASALHAPNCPVRTRNARLLDPYDGGTWVADPQPQPPSASDERERFNRWAESTGKFHVSGYNPNDDLWQAWQARAALDPLPGADEGEHVAEVGETFALHWAGRGSIAPLIERHGLKVGSKLYSRPAPSTGVDAAEPIAYMSGNGMEALRRFGTCAIVAGPARSAVTDCVHPVYAAPPPAASADEWMAEAERLVYALREAAREDGAQGSGGYDSSSIISAEKQAASDEAALLAHLKAYPKG